MRTPVNRFEKVAGYFILAALCLLVVLFVVPGTRFGGFLNQSLFKLHVVADEGLDLAAGDKVVMQGIQIGEIDTLELVSDKVMITCSIYRKYRKKITRDAKVFLIPAAIVGRGKIDIHPGNRSPVMSGHVIEAGLKTSMTERIESLIVQAGELIAKADERVADLKTTLSSLDELLRQVNEGRGTMGRFIYDEEFYTRASLVLEHMENSVGALARLRDPITELGASLPALTRMILEFEGQVTGILKNFEQGTSEFPVIASKASSTLNDTRKVLESLKRSFLIRGNLPRDPDAPGMAPASRREPLIGD